jgi:2-desacetyl-2-hydroxyethyl bacteriochlorophyllide A dehydrogenase
MMAGRWYARGDLRVEKVPIPKPKPDEVLVRVLHCGICGSDLEEYRDGPLTVPITPHPVSGAFAPMVLGHEVVGIVARSAADGSGPPEGTMVIPDVVDGCEECWWCRQHEPGLCPNLVVRGQTTDGGLAEYMVARGRSCVIVPTGVEPREAALTEPLSVAVRAVRKALPLSGARAAVIGAGTIGQLIAQVLTRSLDAADVVVVDPNQTRLALARKLSGANVSTPEQAERLFEPSSGRGFDVIFECTGRHGQLGSALHRVRAGGLVVAVGLRAEEEAISLNDLVLGERRMVGTAAHVWDTDVVDAINLIATKQVQVAELVTNAVPLGDLVSVAMPLLNDPASGAVKVVIDC